MTTLPTTPTRQAHCAAILLPAQPGQHPDEERWVLSGTRHNPTQHWRADVVTTPPHRTGTPYGQRSLLFLSDPMLGTLERLVTALSFLRPYLQVQLGTYDLDPTLPEGNRYSPAALQWCARRALHAASAPPEQWELGHFLLDLPMGQFVALVRAASTERLLTAGPREALAILLHASGPGVWGGLPK